MQDRAGLWMAVSIHPVELRVKQHAVAQRCRNCSRRTLNVFNYLPIACSCVCEVYCSIDRCSYHGSGHRKRQSQTADRLKNYQFFRLSFDASYLTRAMVDGIGGSWRQDVYVV